MVVVKNIEVFEIRTNFGIGRKKFLEILKDNRIFSKKDESKEKFIKRIKPKIDEILNK